MRTHRNCSPQDNARPGRYGEPWPDCSGGVLLIAAIAGSWLAMYGLYLMIF